MSLSTSHFPGSGSAAAANAGALEPENSPFTLIPSIQHSQGGASDEELYLG